MRASRPRRSEFQSSVATGSGSSLRLGPLSFCVYAIEFLDAALATNATGGAFKPAQSYLACHAIELALSAYLSLRGRSLDELGRNMSDRDLGRLLKDAEANGLGKLARLTRRQREQINKAARYYSERVFEYPAIAEAIRGHPTAPDVRVLLAAGTILVSAVREACGSRIKRVRKGTSANR